MILFTGCSLTWGDELEDREGSRFSGKHPNIAECGMSNDLMVMKTIKYIQEHPEIEYVCAQFSVPRRLCYYRNGWKNMTPWTKGVESRVWYKYIDTQENRMMNLWRNVYILEQFLKDIPHYFWRASEDSEKTVETDNIYRKMTKWSDMVTLKDLLGTPDTHPFHYGKGHPNEEGHRLIANHLQGILPNSLYQSS